MKFRIAHIKQATKVLLQKHLPIFLSWLALGVALVVAVWFSVKMVRFALEAKLADPGAKPPLPVLVNIDAFKALSQRIETSKKLQPRNSVILSDPFKVPTPAPTAK